MILIKLIWAFIQTGLFSIGGGYAALPMIRRQVVEIHGWLDNRLFGDLLAISEMTPGPVSLNAATFAGMHTAGIAGAVAATIGCILPSCVIALVLGKLYMHYRKLPDLEGALNGMRTGVAAAIMSAAISISSSSLYGGGMAFQNNVVPAVIFTTAFFILRLKKLNPIYIIIFSGVAGIVFSPH